MSRNRTYLLAAVLVTWALGPHHVARAGTPPPGESGPKGGAPAPLVERIPGSLKGPKPFPVEDPKKARPVPTCLQDAYARLSADAKVLRVTSATPEIADGAIAERKRLLLSKSALLAAGCKVVE